MISPTSPLSPSRERAASTSPQLPPQVIGELRRRVSSAAEEKRPTSPSSSPPPSLSVRQVTPQSNAYWTSVYQRDFFQNDQLFAKLYTYVKKNVEQLSIPSEKEIYKLIKNAGYLLEQIPTNTVQTAIKQCLNLNTLKKVLPDKMNEEQMREVLTLVLDHLQQAVNQYERA